MRAIVIGVGFSSLLFAAPHVEANDHQQEAMSGIRATYGKKVVGLRPVANALLKRYLPQFRVFDATIRTKRRASIAGPPESWVRVLVGTKGEGVFFGPKSRKLLSQYVEISDPLVLLKIYAEVRRFELVSSWKQLAKLCPTKPRPLLRRERKIRPPVVTPGSKQDGAKYQIVFFAVGDPRICSVYKTRVRWSPGSKFEERARRFSWRGGYR